MQLVVDIKKISPEPCSGWTNPARSSSPCASCAPALDPAAPPLGSLWYVNAFLDLGAQNWRTYSRCHHQIPEQRGRITSLGLLAALFPEHAALCCKGNCSALGSPRRNPRSFLQSCSLAYSFLHTVAGVIPSQMEDFMEDFFLLSICFFWTSHVSYQVISPACTVNVTLKLPFWSM